MKHIIITPVFNEEKYLRTYINSIIKQTNRPFKLIVVDDNSTDSSASIIKSYCDKYDWIRYVYHSSKNEKSQGAKVIRAFNYGLSKISLEGIDVITKMDGDLELPSHYFSQINKAFKSLNVGLAGGYILEKKNGYWKKVPQASYHIRGALKSYRVECFNKIGGFMDILGWDGIDEMKSFFYGWESKIIDIGVKHYRPTSSDYDKPALYFKLGSANYKNGGNLFLAFIRSLVKSTRKPYILNGYCYLKGYLISYINRDKRNVNSDLSKFINIFHFKRLISFKRY